MKKHTIKQQGFVSIIVAAVLMILISLVTIGFTKLMQREQRQALDRQLSTQAFYAAETAVNDVRNKVQSGATIAEEKIGCDVSGPDWNNGVINTAVPTVTYTCLEYDTTPIDLVFTETIIRNSSKVFPIETDPAIATIRFEWTGPNGSRTIDTAANTCPSGLPASFNISNAVPMLRIDLIETPNAGDLISRNGLIDRTATLYLYPKTCSGSNGVAFNSYVGADSGRVEDVLCSPPGSPNCYFDVTLPGTNNRYYARVKSIYGDVGTLRVTARDTMSNQVELKNAQVLVDATGKANDVLRRIEVRLSNLPNYNWPEGVIETSNGLCKLLQVAPPNTATNSNCYGP